MAAAAAAAAGGGAAQRRERRRRRRRRWRRRRRQRRERPQRPDWRRRAAAKTADGGGGGGGEDRTTAGAEATRTPAASRTLFKLRISCGPYEPSVMTLDVRYMQLPIRPSSMPASKVTFSQLRQVSYAGWWKGGQGGATANTQCC